MNDELERIWKEAVMVLFKKLSNIYQEGLRKTMKKSWKPIFETFQ
jgi:hypothetical protein